MSDTPKAGWTDQQVEQIVGNLLRAGVVLAAIVTLIGGILYVVQYGTIPIEGKYEHFDERRAELDGFGPLLRQAGAGDSRALIMLGVVLLIATPVSRVAFSVVAFGLQRDRAYVVVTLIVLCVLLYSLIRGLW
ncbi:MAG: DUF1634 domain-containing protein [Gemmataceae bacterium]